jgi:RHS repeat-associated protein
MTGSAISASATRFSQYHFTGRVAPVPVIFSNQDEGATGPSLLGTGDVDTMPALAPTRTPHTTTTPPRACLPRSASADPSIFTGKERDSESGNDYFGARYYASTMGRFMSPDWSAKEEPVPYAKLGNPQSLNLYSYVYNNPLSNVDPDGHLGCGFLWLGNCPTQLAPPPPPPAPPALAVPGTPPSNLAAAQAAARNNPANAPSGVPGTPERTTHCNQATCQIATATNAPTGALLDPKTGLPNLANTDAKTIANSADWGKVSPQTAQDLATLGVTVLGVRPEDPHGHIVTVAPEMLPGDQNVQKYGPLINNIGGSIGVTNANNVFRGTPATYYAPTTPQW